MLEVMPAAAKWVGCKFKGEPTFGSYKTGETNRSTLTAVSWESLPKFVGELSTAGLLLLERSWRIYGESRLATAHGILYRANF